MGFVILFNTAIVITFAKQRPVIRRKGPLVEWAAFREPPYSLFSIGIFLALWGAYFAYYYVRRPFSSLSFVVNLIAFVHRSPFSRKQPSTYRVLQPLHCS